MMRPVVSYDDITAPQQLTPTTEPSTAPVQLGPQLPSTTPQPPTKKRKKSHNSQNHQKKPTNHQHNHSQHRPRYFSHPANHVQHWDEPGGEDASYGGDASMYDENAAGGDGYEEGKEYAEEEDQEEEESRELAHEDIWDDSALIDAWNSATAEYEAYHGKSKKWKEDPVKKSPLWYNVPPSPSRLKKKAQNSITNSTANETSSQNLDGEADNSTPINFNTFVPAHDPSLASAQHATRSSAMMPHPPSLPGPDYAQFYLPNPPGPMVGQDEAFQRALSAMYWGGYWTAVYHYQRHADRRGDADEAQEVEEAEEVEEGDGGEEDFVPTQR